MKNKRALLGISAFAFLAISSLAGLGAKQMIPTFAENAPADINEFTNNGQFTYTPHSVTASTLLSEEEVATDGVLTSGYDGAVLKITGQNSYLTLDFSGSGILASKVQSIDFKIYAYDSAATQLDLRFRKDASSAVINEGSAGHSLLSVRNSWYTYSLDSTTFMSGKSFADFADGSGKLAGFDVFFRTSGAITVYLDSIDLIESGDEDEFTNHGQFTYSSTGSVLMSTQGMAKEGVIASGYEGSVLKTSGTNYVVILDYSAAAIPAAQVQSIDFKIYAHDSAATQLDLRIRKSSADPTVLNEGAAGHSLLSVRNSWTTYSLNSSTFTSGSSFSKFADANGNLSSFEVFLRTSGDVAVYFDSITLKANYVADDELVKNADYLLFTPSDYSISGNNSIPFYKDLGGVFLDSFAFQFNVNIASENLDATSAKINLGATDIYGNNPAFIFYLNDATYKFGMFLNGNYDWDTYNKIPNWTADTDHLVEFYAIKSDATHMVFILGFDGFVLWKTQPKDISGINFTGHTFISFSNKGTSQLASVYSSVPTLTKALNRFGKNKLHSEDIAFDNNANTGACAGENGYYVKAKAFYNTYLTPTQQKEFATNASYENLRNRIVAWGAANGEAVSFNASTGALVISSNRINVFHDHSENIAVIIVAITMAALSMAMMLYHFLRKKKYSNSK